MSKFYVNNKEAVKLKGIVVRDLAIRNKFQTSEPECKILGIRPKRFLESFTKFDGTIDIKLPLEFDQEIKIDDIVEFSELSITPYSFKDKSYVAYSIKAGECKVIDHLNL